MFGGGDMGKELLGKKELLDFLSELLAEVFEEQGQIRKQIQTYNEEIKRINREIIQITNNESAGKSAFSPFAAEEEEKKQGYLLEISELQTKIFDLQDRMVYIQNRIEKIKNLSEIVDQQSATKLKKEYSAFEKIRSLEIQEIERKRISMELHDTTVQNLTTLVHKTELCLKLMDMDMIRAKLELSTMTDILRESIDELREMIYQLRPMSIDDIGLVATLERMVKQNELRESTVSIQLNVVNKEKPVNSIVNIALFRVIQEAYQNTKKYARAEEFYITLVYEEDKIRLSLMDDGMGFEEDEIKDRVENDNHFGFCIMKERIELLSGTIKIDSGKNKGTRIEVEVPLL